MPEFSIQIDVSSSEAKGRMREEMRWRGKEGEDEEEGTKVWEREKKPWKG